MSTPTITVLGSTGRTGGQVARRLLASGATVRAVGRSAEKIPAGADPVLAGLLDTDVLTAAFTGADAAYVLLPFDPTHADVRAQLDSMGASVAQALRDSGVPRVVALSSIGADVPTGTGFLTSLHDQEARLRELDADVLLLRPGYFYDNVVEVIPMMIETNMLADSIDGDVVPLGEADLPYVRMPDDAMTQVLRKVGFSDAASDLLVEMHAAFSDGTVVSRDPHAPRLPTTFEDFFAGALAGVRS